MSSRVCRLIELKFEMIRFTCTDHVLYSSKEPDISRFARIRMGSHDRRYSNQHISPDSVLLSELNPFLRAFDGRQRAVAAPSCSLRRNPHLRYYIDVRMVFRGLNAKATEA